MRRAGPRSRITAPPDARPLRRAAPAPPGCPGRGFALPGAEIERAELELELRAAELRAAELELELRAAPPGPVDPGPVDPGPVDPGPVDPGPADPGPVDPGPAAPGPRPQ